jgi:hypothetical protein
MPTKTDRLVELEDLSGRLEDALDREKQRRMLDSVLTQCRALETLVGKLETWTRANEGLGFTRCTASESGAEKLLRLREFGTALGVATMPSLVDLQFRFDGARSDLRALLDLGADDWKAELGKLSWCRPLGLALQNIARTSTTGRELLAIAHDAELLVSFPPPADRVKQFKGLWKRAEDARAKLTALGMDPAVERFLLAMSNGGAPLPLLDTAVLKWLTDNGVAQYLRISFQ